MVRESTIGRVLFGAVAVAFGVQCLIFSKFVHGLEPVPATLVPPIPWAWVNGVFLIGCGVSLLIDRVARVGALLLAGLFVLSTVVLHGPLLAGNLKNAADAAFHTLAIGAAAMVLAAEVGRGSAGEGRWEQLLERGRQAGLVCFGLCTIGHGVMHFVFFGFTADFIPGWIPFHPFWAAATGVAQIAAGLAILSGVLARLAATLAGVMYGSWVLIVHIPRVMEHPDSRTEWTSVVIASALCASALVVAGALARSKSRASMGDPAAAVGTA